MLEERNVEVVECHSNMVVKDVVGVDMVVKMNVSKEPEINMDLLFAPDINFA